MDQPLTAGPIQFDPQSGLFYTSTNLVIGNPN